jgi:hypothetical protein
MSIWLLYSIYISMCDDWKVVIINRKRNEALEEKAGWLCEMRKLIISNQWEAYLKLSMWNVAENERMWKPVMKEISMNNKSLKLCINEEKAEMANRIMKLF